MSDGPGPSRMTESLVAEIAAWVARAREGDDDAFAEVVRAFERPVYNLCYRMLGDGAEAEDAAQETFLRAYRGLQRFDPNRSFVSWLLAIAAHYCIDLQRKRRMTFTSFNDVLSGESIAADLPGPEETLALREGQELLQRALAALADKDRAAVVLHYWYEMSYEEISQVLGMSLSAVKSRLHRARRGLAQQWLIREGGTTIAVGGRADEAAMA